MKTVKTWGFALMAALALSVSNLVAHAPSGAIFTTVEDGSEVNFNHYPSKEAVYLDGGPGIGAPQTAAGLDDGRYIFQVTDPPGKKLLSTDLARCRQFDVSGGVITAVVPAVNAGGQVCEHSTGNDIDHPPAKTVQLIPYLDTPNRGGVYKVWVVRVEDFLAGCAALGVANGLDAVNCGFKPKNAHGFIPSHSKTDNFKVKEEVPVVEIDTRFTDVATGQFIDGLSAEWSDPVGASNVKWSYFDPSLYVIHEAHVEGVEDGYHQITIDDQPGCLVHDIWLTEVRPGKVSPTEYVGAGQQTITVPVSARGKELTVFVDVDCHPN